MTWTKQRVKDWIQFSAELDKLGVKPPLDQSLVFRGQSKSKRSLLPKICRGPGRDSSAPRIIELEGATRRVFASQAHMHLPSSVIPSDESSVLNWWFLMQHHNAPTRLLDWSQSPYVAAYFAVVNNWESDGAVWCFDHHRMDEYMTLQHGDKFEGAIDRGIDDLLTDHLSPEMLFTLTRFKKSERMVAQQGLSTLCTNVLADHADVIPNAFSGDGASATCMKLEIPAECKQSFLIHLRSMNITANALFPGIDGLGWSVQELLRVSL